MTVTSAIVILICIVSSSRRGTPDLNIPNEELTDRVLTMQAIWSDCNQYWQHFGRYPRIDEVCADGTIRNWRVKLLSFTLARLAEQLSDVNLGKTYSERRELYLRASQALDGCVDLSGESGLGALVNELRRDDNRVRDVFALAKNDLISNILAIGGQASAFDPKTNGKCDEVSGSTIILIEGGYHGMQWWKVEGVIDRRAFDLLNDSEPHDFLIAFADGTVWCMRSDTPAAALDKFMNLETSGKYDRAHVLERWRLK